MNIIEKHFKQIEVELSQRVTREYFESGYDNKYSSRSLDRVYEMLTEDTTKDNIEYVRRYLSATVSWKVENARQLVVTLSFGDKMRCNCHMV